MITVKIGYKRVDKGYGLIELMLTISIIGLLTMIVYPNYKNYVKKTKRIEMLVELQSIATKIHAKAILNSSYHILNLSPIFKNSRQKGQQTDSSKFAKVPNSNVLSIYPVEGTALYTISLTPLSSETGLDSIFLSSANWKLIATPIDGELMSNDGQISLDAQGVQCHVNLCQ